MHKHDEAPPPRLTLDIELEGVPVIGIFSMGMEDELRLRQWLRRSDVLDVAQEVLAGILDELDRIDRIEAA